MRIFQACQRAQDQQQNSAMGIQDIYGKHIMDNFNNTFGFDTSKKNAAIPPDYKPELYTTDLYNDSEKAQDWTCTGEMQWAINLSRIYII